MLEVIIEDSLSGLRYPVEVSGDAPLWSLVPALVKVLRLPQEDSTGNRLSYRLSLAESGQELPRELSLEAAGVKAGETLQLRPYMVGRAASGRAPAEDGLHDAVTLADGMALPLVGAPGSPVADLGQQTVGRKRSRRLVLSLLGLTVLGAAGASAGYAAYRTGFLGRWLATLQPQAGPAATVVPKQMPTATAVPLPTTARASLVFAQHRQTVRALAWSPDGKLLASGSLDGQLLIWNTQGQVQHTFTIKGAVRTLAWSPDGTQLALGAGSTVQFLDPYNGAPLTQPLQRHTATVTAVAWAPRGQARLVSASLDKLAIVWDGKLWRPLQIFRRHTSPLEAASWAADGQTIATASTGGLVRVWRADGGQEVHGYYQDGQLTLRTLAFAPTGAQLAVGGDDGQIRLWNGLTCQRQQTAAFGTQCVDGPQRLRLDTQPLRTLAWSPDGRLLASAGNDGVLAVWYPARSQMPLLTVRLGTPVLSLHWSADGRTIATAAGNRVTLWQLS
ncbi:EsaB/YukD family protein [Thermogemmatispora onikobensis]|uniref:WD40 domain-containing protein n=1 Tax=Thermogemmatispora onikobensis TaxID=732234 RepID=UPI00085390FA|nr:EsaB/YukD family protein [Thermogemmatispora onikobensis]